MVVPNMNWEFVISLKTGRLGAVQPLSAQGTPVNHQPLAAGLYTHISVRYLEAEWLKLGTANMAEAKK